MLHALHPFTCSHCHSLQHQVAAHATHSVPPSPQNVPRAAQVAATYASLCTSNSNIELKPPPPLLSLNNSPHFRSGSVSNVPLPHPACRVSLKIELYDVLASLKGRLRLRLHLHIRPRVSRATTLRISS